MIKRLVLAALVFTLVAGLAGAGTFAYFQDAETSTANSFTAGTLDLELCDPDEGWRDGVSATWVLSSLAPGDTSTVMYEVGLRNAGSVNGNHVRITFSHDIDETLNPVEADTNPNSDPADLARYVEIRHMDYNGHCFVGSLTTPGHTIVDANGNGWIDLDDVTLPDNAPALDNLTAPMLNGANAKNFHIALGFRPEAGNDIQGDTLITTVKFTLNQDAGQ